MSKKVITRQHNRVLRDCTQVKEHYKMYKVGKLWMFAGLFTLSFGAGVFFGENQDAHAEVTTAEPTASETNSGQSLTQQKSVAIDGNSQSTTQAQTGSAQNTTTDDNEAGQAKPAATPEKSASEQTETNANSNKPATNNEPVATKNSTDANTQPTTVTKPQTKYAVDAVADDPAADPSKVKVVNTTDAKGNASTDPTKTSGASQVDLTGSAVQSHFTAGGSSIFGTIPANPTMPNVTNGNTYQLTNPNDPNYVQSGIIVANDSVDFRTNFSLSATITASWDPSMLDPSTNPNSGFEKLGGDGMAISFQPVSDTEALNAKGAAGQFLGLVQDQASSKVYSDSNTGTISYNLSSDSDGHDPNPNPGPGHWIIYQSTSDTSKAVGTPFDTEVATPANNTSTGTMTYTFETNYDATTKQLKTDIKDKDGNVVQSYNTAINDERIGKNYVLGVTGSTAASKAKYVATINEYKYTPADTKLDITSNVNIAQSNIVGTPGQTIAFYNAGDPKPTDNNGTPVSEAYAVPPVTGYKLEKTQFITLSAGDTNTINLTYTPVAETANIIYVDGDDGNKVITTTPLSGNNGQTVNYNVAVPDGYVLPKGAATTGSYTFKPSGNTDVTITLNHQHVSGTYQATGTVTLTGLPTGDKAQNPTVPINYTTDTDKVTGVTTYTPTGNPSVPAPAVDGYTPANSTVTFTTTTGTDKPTNQTTTLNYTPNKQATQITYVDGDNGNKVVTTTPLNGVTNQTVNYNVAVPDGYVLPKGTATTGSYTFKPSGNTGVTITLNHQHVTGTYQTTGTVTLTGLPAGDKTKNPTVPINYTTDTDKVTGVTTYTPTGNPSVPAPAVDGYTPDKTTATFTATTGTDKPQDQTTTLNYTPNQGKINIVYVDGDNGNKVVTTTPLNGVTDQTVNYKVNVPDGYVLPKGAATIGSYTFKPSGNGDVTITINHQHVTGTVTTTDHLTYAGLPAGSPTGKDVTVNWTTDTDKVSGVTTYTPSNGKTTITPDKVTGYTTDGDVTFTETPGNTKPVNQTKQVTYTPTNQAINMIYVDGDNGNKVVTTTSLNGKTGQSVNYKVDVPDGYVLPKGAVTTGSYTFKPSGNGDVTITLNHQHVPGTYQATGTVSLTGIPAGDKTPNPTVPINYTTDTDKVTGVTTYTPTGNPSVPAPTVDGYTPANPTVTFTTTTGTDKPQNQTTTLNYTPNKQATQITYVDGDNGNKVITTTPLNGVTDQTVNYKVDVPDGYELPKGAATTGSYTFEPSGNAGVTITLKHQHVTGTATTIDHLTYTGLPAGSPIGKDATVNWTTDTDKVTNITTYTPNNGAITITPDKVTGYTVDGDVTFTEIPSITKPVNQTKAVTYTQIRYTYTIQFKDYNGKVVGTGTFTSVPNGNYDFKTDIPKGYVLTPGKTNTMINVPSGYDPSQPIIVNVTTPAGVDAPGIVAYFKDEVPTENVPHTTLPAQSRDTIPNDDQQPSGPQEPNKDNQTPISDKQDSKGNPNVKADNNTIATDRSNNTAGQLTGSKLTNNGVQSGNAEAGQAQQAASINNANTNTVSSNTAKSKAATLPQTNEQSASVWAMIGLGLMSMLSMLGITKKKREDEK